jgi:hypothetical protein
LGRSKNMEFRGFCKAPFQKKRAVRHQRHAAGPMTVARCRTICGPIVAAARGD